MAKSLFETILEQKQVDTKTVKQQRVLEAAIQLFSEKGYSNTSTAEIAKTAEVSEGTIFKHYGTKEQLLLSIILPFIKEFVPIIAQGVLNETLTKKEMTFEQLLKSLLKNRVDFISKNREIFQVIVKEIFYKESLKDELIPYFSTHITPLFGEVVDEFKKRGELKNIPTNQILSILFSLIGGYFVSQFVLFDSYNISDEEIEQIVLFAMEGIRNSSAVAEDSSISPV